MNQLFSLQWWFSCFATSWPWWTFCVLASIVALPLTLRMFRGLSDRGAGLATGVGLILITFLTWLFSLEGLSGPRESAFVRLLILAAACFLFPLALLFRARGYVRGRGEWTVFWPAAVCLVVGLFPLPHHGFTVWLSLLLVALSSVAAWSHDVAGLRAALRRVLVPFLAAQVIFFVAFLFFVNVRSYLPWATFELSLYQAEKWGNYTHLNSIMHSNHMPPTDLWFNDHPINYYYGGHLFVATIAKALGTDPRIAFNLGLATIFALTMAMSFTFSLSLVHLVTRKVRLIGPVVWHSGMAWGIFGMLAISMFGNLDPWRQLFTRDVDYGVRLRWEREQRRGTEDWKLRHGISHERILGLVAVIQTTPEEQRADTALRELDRLEAQLSEPTRVLAGTAEELKETIERYRQQGVESGPQVENALYSQAFGPSTTQAMRDQNVVNGVELEDRVYTLLSDARYGDVVDLFVKIAAEHQPPTSLLADLKQRIEAPLKAAMESGPVERLETLLWNREYESAIQGVLVQQPAYIQLRFEKARSSDSSSDMITLIRELETAARNSTVTEDQMQAELRAAVVEASRAFRIEPARIILDRFDNALPDYTANPTIKQLRFTWQNVTFIDFWAPSRAVKSTPPGVKEAGTVTEFPYFSAILGDLHPHHMALPYTLAALCACLSLLRKSSRLKRDDVTWLRRGWPDLLCMAFFIGAVFPVNLWDSIVLGPLYAIVILVALKGVRVGPGWRWIGFVGFVVLLSGVIGVIYNSIPGVVPLFRDIRLFGLGVLAVFPGIPVAMHLLPHVPKARVVVGFGALALLCVGLGALLAPVDQAGGGSAPGLALRDVLVFGAIVLLGAYWTLGKHPDAHRWWYAAGAVYACVGIFALLLILPFKLYFQSPLQPEIKLLYDYTPPILSHEMVASPNRFWSTFWKASPVNPFAQNLRTDLRDYIHHWGIFLLPIIPLLIGRFFRASRGCEPGFPFMIAMLALGITALARNYLGYWVGALSLGLMVFCLYYAFVFARRAEGPVWIFLSAAFFWSWFVEALHFDDDMGGNYERYNTLFKVYYPLWILFAGGMVVAVRELFARFRFHHRTPTEVLASTEFWTMVILAGIVAPLLLKQVFPESVARFWFFVVMGAAAVVVLTFVYTATADRVSRFAAFLCDSMSRLFSRWPALAVALFICLVGMYYPFAATLTRTREFFTWPMPGTPEARMAHRRIYTDRTLDALAHLAEYPRYRQDYKAFTWVDQNLAEDAKVLERTSEEAYNSIGRIATGSGRRTVMGWKHHQHQWRGRGRIAPKTLEMWYFDNRNRLYDFAADFQRIMGGAKPGIDDDIRSLLASPLESDWELALNSLYPGATADQRESMLAIVRRIDGLPNLRVEFRQIATGIEDDFDRSTERILRLAGTDKRVALLRTMIPDLTLMQYYRLANIVDKSDLTMNQIMGRMLEDVEEVYLTDDRERAFQILRYYDIDYVVVGDLERELYRQRKPTDAAAARPIESKLDAWGFVKVYDSSEQLLPGEDRAEPGNAPTVIYRLPADRPEDE